MYTNKNRPEYYTERIFYMLLLLKNYCQNNRDIYEIGTIIPGIEYTCSLADKLYSYFINNETFE